MVASGSVSGAVNTSSGPLPGACVTAVPTAAAVPASRAVLAVTGSDGSYRIGGLVPGSYTVQFSSGCGAIGYATRWWNDASSQAGATAITVAPGADTGGISTVLAR
jgi:hypothetical protein